MRRVEAAAVLSIPDVCFPFSPARDLSLLLLCLESWCLQVGWM